jgi:thiosulfate/3-mercaptopyruvate sulfurtransferase
MAGTYPQDSRTCLMVLTSILPPLVEAGWLRAQIGSPDLIVLDARVTVEGATYVSGRASFEADGHVPGARFADLCNGFSDPQGTFLFTRPQQDAFRAVVQALGISKRHRIVVYDSLTGAWAARVWWVLRAFGHAHVQVLNGGLQQWQMAGGALAFGHSSAPMPGDFDPMPQSGYFVDLPDILERGPGLPLVCALREETFVAGHIPGSVSIPYRSVLNDDGRIDPARAKNKLGEAGFSSTSDAVFYCGGGINAAGLALATVAAGFKLPRIFDGSLEEWVSDPARPLEQGQG